MLFVRHSPRSLSTTQSEVAIHDRVKKVVVVGSGLMGSGIAQVTAQHNFTVTMVDQSDEFLSAGSQRISKSLDRVLKKQVGQGAVESRKAEVLSLLSTSTDLQAACDEADLVIEAVPEQMKLKHELFRNLHSWTPERAVLASNTSSFSVTDIAKGLDGDAAQSRVIGLHFFNPPPVLPLIEVVRTDRVDETIWETGYAFADAVGEPVECADTPGFIVNRLLVPYIAEAVRMLERGDAQAPAIDKAMRLGAAMPIGPISLADMVGLDTMKFVLDGWHQRFPNNPLFEPSPMLNELVEQGHLGNKTGKGFYDHKK
jgi:3-hydroxyacyl-CoA dehydrogenase